MAASQENGCFGRLEVTSLFGWFYWVLLFQATVVKMKILNTSLNSLYSSSGIIFSMEYRARTRKEPGSIPFRGMCELSWNHSSVACPFCSLFNWHLINTWNRKWRGKQIFWQNLTTIKNCHCTFLYFRILLCFHYDRRMNYIICGRTVIIFSNVFFNVQMQLGVGWGFWGYPQDCHMGGRGLPYFLETETTSHVLILTSFGGTKHLCSTYTPAQGANRRGQFLLVLSGGKGQILWQLKATQGNRDKIIYKGKCDSLSSLILNPHSSIHCLFF